MDRKEAEGIQMPVKKERYTAADENYLKAVYAISKQKGYARSIDVTEYLGVSKPSVSVAVRRLEEKGLLYTDEHMFLYLTEEGEKIGKDTFDKFDFLEESLVNLGIDRMTAMEDAHKMEHDLSDETFEALRNYLKKSGIYHPEAKDQKDSRKSE